MKVRVQFNRVKSHAFHAGSGLAEELDRLLDLFNRHFPWCDAAGKRDGRRRHARQPLKIAEAGHPQGARGCGPADRKLYADFRAGFVNRFRQGI
jgi:hypothetical protein